jgi:hypothetical protein
VRAVPDIEPGSPGRFDEALTDDVRASADLAFRTWVAAFAVAERLGLPLFSDDRFVRAHAHGAGISSFGTPALLEALVERGLLGGASRDFALRRLRISGAMGLAPDPEQLVEETEEADWDVTPLVARALFDPAAWRDASAMAKHITFLRETFHRAREAFPRWVARVHDAGRSAVLPEQRASIAPSLLVLAWLSGDAEFAREVLRVLRQLEPLPDPLARAFAILGAFTADAPQAIRVAAIQSAFASVDHADRMRLFAMLRFE